MLRYPEVSNTRGRKSPGGRTLWCGPFAVAVLTGLSYDEAYAKVLASVRRDRMAFWVKRYGRERAARLRKQLPTALKGTSHLMIDRALGKLGVGIKATVTFRKQDQPTFLTFAREHTVKGRVYLIDAGNHWMTLKDGIVYHSWYAPKPVEEMGQKRLARVERWSEVRPLPGAFPPAPAMAEAA